MSKRFEEYGFPLCEDRNVIPDDDTTLFVCSGMQKLKPRFALADGTVYGSIQSCIRTNDLDLVGDGSHLTSFQMIGNFSFGTNDYSRSVEMWRSILDDLDIKYVVHYHPSRLDHKQLWGGCDLQEDLECTWSDGNIGGECCEIYVGGLEIGNLVNPLNHSTDVGFGLERMVQVLEGKKRVDEISLFEQELHPIARDHIKTLELMKNNGVIPGNKGRNYVCRRLLRRLLRLTSHVPTLDWMDSERVLLDKRMSNARRMWRKHKDKPQEWWWDSCGILPEEINFIGETC